MTHAASLVTQFILIIAIIPALLQLIPSEDNISVINRRKKRVEQFFLFGFEVLDRTEFKKSDKYALEFKFQGISRYKCNHGVIMKFLEHPHRYKLVNSYCLEYGTISLVNDDLRIEEREFTRTIKTIFNCWAWYLTSSAFILLANFIPPNNSIKLFDYPINIKTGVVLIFVITSLISVYVLFRKSKRIAYMYFLRRTFEEKTDSGIAQDSTSLYWKDVFTPYKALYSEIRRMVKYAISEDFLGKLKKMKRRRKVKKYAE